MKGLPIAIGLIVLCAVPWMGKAAAQQSAVAPAVSATNAVPNLINYSGVLKDASGPTLASISGVTFLLYKDEQGGAPLWLETQNVTPDKSGHYAVQLGTNSASGIPADLFINGEPRWLAVQIGNEAEQPRVLLVAVPYAMKAADAATIGGLPPSAFVLAAPSAASGTVAANPTAPAQAAGSRATSDVTTTGGTANTLPLFTTATNVQNSIVTQTGSGATGKIGINTTTPSATLYVNGAVTSNGVLTSPASGTATAAGGKNSQPQDFIASVFNSGTSTAVPQKFQWQAEPAGNDTSTASGTLNLLFASGTATPAETGLKISSKGVFSFAAGQTFPGTGDGSVKSVGLAAPTSDFKVTGSPVTTTGTLTLGWLVAPTNANTANAIVKRDSAGSFSAEILSVDAVNAVSNGGAAIFATAPVASATTIAGYASATTGEGWGVLGSTSSTDPDAIGVYGFADASGGTQKGVKGYSGSTFGTGVYGENVGASTVGSVYGDAGVWGDTTSGIGVSGSSDNGNGVFAVNNDTSGSNYSTVYIEDDENIAADYSMFYATSSNYGGSCNIDVSGDLSCSGTVTAAAAVDAGRRKVALYAIEGPENWFEDIGTGHLANGSALVTLEPVFAQTVNTGIEYHVFLTPKGDCKGLYVSNEGPASFEVHELGGGTSTLAFDYRIVAKRKGYESIRLADKTKALQVHGPNRRTVPLKSAPMKPAIPVVAAASEKERSVTK